FSSEFETLNVSGDGRPAERFTGPYMSANAFRVLGVQPVLGRDFLPGDDRPGAPAVVMLGYGVWKSRYGSDPSVLGRTIKVNEQAATVIGVMPEGMQFPVRAELW